MSIRTFEVIVDNLEQNPHCLHGPTLIFRKNKGNVPEFFACSACRDQSICNFHVSVNEKKNILLKMSEFWKNQQKEIVTSIISQKPYDKYCNILQHLKTNMKNNNSQIWYCYSCNILMEKNDFKEHEKCQISSNLTYYNLTHPTSFILPKTDSKQHAQFFFSDCTTKEICLLLKKLEVSKVLCIGVPKVHEYINNNCKNSVQSLLLDFDKNYFNFYNENEFIWYNMFNNYIFIKQQKKILKRFIVGENLVILIDPPFGGRVEPLARTLRELNKIYIEVNRIKKKGELKLKVLWFFPYFMEQHIKESLPDFKMFDYKVNYDNHSSFTDTGNKKRKFGSPVRIFTNISLSLLDLEGFSGYKFCRDCGYYVSVENRHCRECNACTSKNGTTYVHCSECTKCVKPSYKHCKVCSRCCLSDHVCGEFQPDQNCYHCHQPGHKKKDCMFLRENEPPKKKKKIRNK